jgi:molybdopterin molybdotransferase
MSLIAPQEVLRRMLAAAPDPVAVEQVALATALGRTLASPLAALVDQPPFAASAMDGYAVRAEDIDPERPLKVIGSAVAGRRFAGQVGPGQAVRIFTGAPMPQGADTVLIQENATRLSEDAVLPLARETRGRFVRPAGLDFAAGVELVAAGQVLDARQLGLAASMGHSMVPVRRKPRVAILSTGDELVAPGTTPGPDQIVSSNALALGALLSGWGAEPIDLGIVPDQRDATAEAIAGAAANADLIVTCGGASVGEHDHVQAALIANGYSIDVWRVAIRPGKPFMFGRRGSLMAVGLPGNPVSSHVCAIVFVEPLVRALLGQSVRQRVSRARLGQDLPANDQRQDYMRASLEVTADGTLIARPFDTQDSSIQRLLAKADALLIRPAHAPAARAGDLCEIIVLPA